MHSDDIELVKNPTFDKVAGNCNYESVIYKVVFKLLSGKITKVINKTLDNFEKFKPDFYLNDGDQLNQYGFDAEVLHVPGHTRGSIAILALNGNLVAGDTFANAGKKPGIAPNALNFDILKESVKKLKTKDIKTVYPGHGSPFEMNAIK
jgi:glyoxylase-like metal-dependent hydrolase (beta-lactamase superfamily II)